MMLAFARVPIRDFLTEEHVSLISENIHEKSLELFILILVKLKFFLLRKVKKTEGFL